MKKVFGLMGLFALSVGVYLMAADHIDAPAVGSITTGSANIDITDFYAFESPADPDNYVFVGNVNGFLGPEATETATFDEQVMYEFNIDTDSDNTEDLVIQVLFRDDKVIALGPVAPESTGLNSSIVSTNMRVEADVTPYGQSAIIGTANGMKLFAGPRDDSFFMDFFKFVAIVDGVGGAANPPTAFDTPGQDAFAGTNVLSFVIELPKDMIGGSSVRKFNTWLTSNKSL